MWGYTRSPTLPNLTLAGYKWSTNVLAIFSVGNIRPETYLIGGYIDHRRGNGRNIYELTRFIIV